MVLTFKGRRRPRAENDKNTMTITIGIPSYQQAEYLMDAIESALTQTIPCEVIVVDDGSTDDSLKIAQEYKVSPMALVKDDRLTQYGSERRLKVISQVNKGLASARNTIIMNMTGEYLLPLDADDILKENAVERILEVIQETDADIVAPSFKTFGTTNQEVILGPANVFDFLEANRIGYFSAIRKSKLLEIGGYSPRMTFGWEDWALWINLLDRGAKLVTMKDVLVGYRTKEVSMITEANKHADELTAQMRKDFAHLYA